MLKLWRNSGVSIDIEPEKKDLIRWAKRRAKKQGVSFNLTEDDFDIPFLCPVLSIPLFKGKGISCDNSPTLDRVVPEVGYVPGNIIVISNRANRIKSNATWREICLVQEFYEHWITQNWMKGC